VVDLVPLPVQYADLCHMAKKIFTGRGMGQKTCILEKQTGWVGNLAIANRLPTAVGSKHQGAIVGIKLEKICRTSCMRLANSKEPPCL
jgi:hypothetical protein